MDGKKRKRHDQKEAKKAREAGRKKEGQGQYLQAM